MIPRTAVHLVVWALVGASAPSALAATRHVDGTCANDGDGSSAACADSPGGTGAWNAITSICGGSDDVVEIHAGSYTSGNDYWNLPAGCSGAPGHPLVIQNHAGDDVVIHGLHDISDSTWTARGGGVYECTGGACSTSTGQVFPMAAWYQRPDQAAEEVLYLKMSGACDETLPIGFMRYVDGNVCVHLSDDVSPATTDYLRIPYLQSGLLLNNYGTHDVTFRRNPKGGSFTWEKFVQYVFVLTPQDNTNIRFEGLDIGYVADRCIDIESVGGPRDANIQIVGNHIHHCGQEAVHDADDTSPDAIIADNEFDHIQAPPWFEQCWTMGGCELPGFGDKCSALRLFGNDGLVVANNVFHDDCGGLYGAGYDIDLEGHASDVLVDGNVSYSMAVGNVEDGQATVAWFMQSQTNGPYDGITWRNNRAFSVDYCFAIDLGTAGEVDVDFVDNTCVDFREAGLAAYGGNFGTVGGNVDVINDLWVALSTTPDAAIVIADHQPGYAPAVTNAFWCPSCTALVRHEGMVYDEITVAGFGAGNVVGDPLLDVAGAMPSLRLSAPGGSAYQAGTALVPGFPDFDGEARPAMGAWDIGADAYSEAPGDSGATTGDTTSDGSGGPADESGPDVTGAATWAPADTTGGEASTTTFDPGARDHTDASACACDLDRDARMPPAVLLLLAIRSARRRRR